MKLKREAIEAVYELAPLQQGMFIHSRYGAERDVYLSQLTARLEGPLDAEAFRRAWERTQERHGALRTSFHWQDLPKPLQVVEKPSGVPLDWTVVDWRERATTPEPNERLDERFEELVAADRARPFQLSKAPLERLTLVREAAERHRLLWSFHHLLLDGWSIPLVLADVFAFYRAETTGAEPELPPVTPYRDYILWLKAQDPAASEEYWRRALAGFTEPTPVALDAPGPGTATPEGEAGLSTLRREVAVSRAELEATAKAFRVTVNTLVQGAWGLLLGRMAGHDDVVFGATTAGRPPELTGIETMVGLTINTLPVRLGVEPGQAVGDWLRRLQQSQGESRAFEHAPLVQIQSWSPVPRGTPLFESLLVFESFPVDRTAASAPGALALADVKPYQKVNYPLSLVVSPREREVLLRLVWDPTRFAAGGVERLHGRLLAVLSALGEAGDGTLLSALPVMGAAERDEIRRAAGDAAAVSPEPPLIHRLVARAAATTPEADAIVASPDPADDDRAPRDAERVWSHRQLDRSAGRVARRLVELGVGPEERVGVMGRRRPELAAGLLGVLRAGGAYLPLDPDYPRERLERMVADAGVRTVVTDRRSADLAAPLGPGLRTLDLDDVVASPDLVPLAADAVEVSPDQLAYVIYTSGSTGEPKGVAVAHRGVVQILARFAETLELGPGRRHLLFASINFDAAVNDLFAPLVVGATVVWADRDERMAGPGLVALLRQRRVTSAVLPPAVLASLPAEELPDLAVLASAGEAVTGDLVGRWLGGIGGRAGRTFWNLYGPTETSVGAAAHRCRPGEGDPPLGRPFAHMQVWPVDRSLRLAPVGAPAELAVGGAGVTRGYLGRPAQTAERFVPDPFSQRPGARLYRTGDRVRLRPSEGRDSRFEFLGRIDRQVKVRGFRIETGEVEAALAAHPSVAVAVVGERGGRLVAWVLPENLDLGCREPALREHLAGRLPDWMIPSVWVTLDELPLDPHGKVDRKSLPERPVDDAPAGEPPATPFEAWLAAAWEEILGRPAGSIGRDDRFFDLGGDSIRGAILINRLEAELSEYVYITALFEAPDLAGFAGALAATWPAAVAERFGASSVPSAGSPDSPEVPGTYGIEVGIEVPGTSGGPVDAADLAHFRSLLEPLAPLPAGTAKNPPAVFVLSPPRSGSTLLRVMLGGSPELFAPPELELLSFDTMGERREALSGADAFWREGSQRSVMALLGCDADEARRVQSEAEDEGLSVAAFYARLQEWAAPRLLVDKTPSYALDPTVLQRAEDGFEDTRYVHLVRHPYACIRSFEDARLEQVFFRRDHGFDRRRLAELAWRVSHENILAFVAELPPERVPRVRYEDLVRRPEETLDGLCRFLGIEPTAAMLDPYGRETDGDRMTDGVHPLAKQLGDVKFHQHRRIDPGMADRWRGTFDRHFLAAETWALARELGYRDHPGRSRLTATPRRPGDAVPLSFGQERLWFIDRLEPGGAGYHMPVALRLTGPLDRAALAAALGLVVERHQVLRTTYRQSEGEEPEGRLSSAPAATLPVVDLSALADPDLRRRELERVTAAEARRPFDLATDPALRALAVVSGADEHAVLVTLHHIASDGWSTRVLVGETVAAYGALVAGEAPRLPALDVQYADWADWQRRRLSGSGRAARLAFWKDHLDGAPHLFEMPADRPRPPVQGFRGGRVPVRLEADAVLGLDRLARAAGATRFMALVGLWGTLLARLSGVRDLVVGTPVANRDRAEVEGLIGFFVNTLALRLDLSGDPTPRGLAERLRASVTPAYAHQDLPFEALVEELAPERSTAHQPLVQVVFALQAFGEASTGPRTLPGLEIAPLDTHSGTAKFDLTLSLSEGRGADGADGLAGSLEYRTDLFDPATAERFARLFERLVASAGQAPDRPVSQLPLHSAAERRALLGRWGERRSFAGTSPLDRFRARAAAEPGAPAVTGWVDGVETTLSYGELARRARALGARLAGLGVGPEVPVALVAGRTPELVVALLGILEAGGAYLPVDPAYPSERRRLLVSDGLAGMARPVVVTAGLGASEAADVDDLGLAATVVDVGQIGDDVPAGWTPPSIDPDQLAYVIYTSGSTGRPKGVGVTHGNVDRLLAAAQAVDPWSADDVWSLFHSYAFDFSVWELWGPLAFGGRTVVVPDDVRRSPERFAALLADQGVTILDQTPSAFRALSGVTTPRELPSLRRVIFGGEALEPASLIPWYEGVDAGSGDAGPRLVNMYGITETTVHVTHRPLSADDARADAAGQRAGSDLGEPLPDLDLRVVDRHLEPVPLGGLGELVVAGAGLARGYLGRPALTARRFVPDPDPASPGARLYRSGDLARPVVRDGRPEVEYRGRIDAQVKIRGFRIEPGEIVAALARHPGVSEAAVVVAEVPVAASAGTSEETDRRLVAYAVPSEGSAGPVRRLVRLAASGRLDGVDLHRLPDGLTVAHLNRSETEFVHREIFVDGAYSGHGLTLPPGAVVFDVGANIGLFSLWAHRQAPGVRLVAFEPIPAVADVLEANAALHGLDASIHRAGLSDVAETVEMTWYPHASVLSGRHAGTADEEAVVRSYLLGSEDLSAAQVEEILAERLRSQVVEAPLLRLSDVLRTEGVERIDLLKVDVEKAELEVLRGLDDDDWPKVRQVVAEVHDVDGRLAAVAELLESHGFRVATEQDPTLAGTRLWNLYAVRPGRPGRPGTTPEEAPATAPGPREGSAAEATWESSEDWAADLRAALARELPAHMVPAHFVALPALPLTAHGKLDRRALPLPSDAPLARLGEGRPGGGRAPESDLERRIAALWRQVLGVDEVHLDDDFFDLGGHSLSAVRLGALLRRELGRDVPLAALFRHRTLGGLARRLAEDGDDAPATALVPLAPVAGAGETGGGASWVLVHPAGGTSLPYRGLAEALAQAEPGVAVHGLEAPGTPTGSLTETADRLAPAVAAMAAMAAVAAMPGLAAPVRLAGWSYGGHLAWELARSLAGRGVSVERLVLLDAGPAQLAALPELDEAALLAMGLGTAAGLGAETIRAWPADERLTRTLDAARAAGVLPEGMDEAAARRLLDHATAHGAALARHRPGPWPTDAGPAPPVELVLADDTAQRLAEAGTDLGWNALLGPDGVRVHRVPFDHQRLVSPAAVAAIVPLLVRPSAVSVVETVEATP
jgi:amino acid adenylation domain-containing protein/FkbM family methyltransferase